MNVKELSKKDIRDILRKISEYYGVDINFLQRLFRDFCWLSNKEGKIYIVHKYVKKYIKQFNPHRVGLYIAKRERNYIRLSIEGTQLLGEKISKRVIETDAQLVLTQNELSLQLDKGYYVFKSKKDYIGCGFAKGNKVKVMISKNRKILGGGEKFGVEEKLREEQTHS